MLKTWRNGEKADVVQKIIENNFKVLGRYLSRNMLCLSTTERELLSSDYLSDGLIVFDTTLESWMQYNKGIWVEVFIGVDVEVNNYIKIIKTEDWIDNKIYIPLSDHHVKNPTVQLFMLYGETYSPVIGGIYIENEHDIVLKSDMPFKGKVVIK